MMQKEGDVDGNELIKCRNDLETSLHISDSRGAEVVKQLLCGGGIDLTIQILKHELQFAMVPVQQLSFTLLTASCCAILT